MKLLVLLAFFSSAALGLDNGLCATPPMGFNSYMAHTAGEKGLGSIADFFVSSGLRESGYTFVNTDEVRAFPNALYLLRHIAAFCRAGRRKLETTRLASCSGLRVPTPLACPPSSKSYS